MRHTRRIGDHVRRHARGFAAGLSLVSLYCSLAVLTHDAIAVIDDVEVGKFHDYAYTYR